MRRPSGALGQHGFIRRLEAELAAHLERAQQDVAAKGLRRLREEDVFSRQGRRDWSRLVGPHPARLLHRVGHRKRGDRGAVLDRRGDGAIDQGGGNERPRRVVDGDDVGVGTGVRHRVRHRVLPPGPALHTMDV